ncbi:VOC family protein [Paucilactobacillus suebicus]|uniref:Glyoxalase bleomycin resistance protein dioxygenase n=1 Tax=Paucilactobacillus suebicus DSM 5007 = KCTC 3549 TaxID=1423807 RepID=A0A0R1W575_9LACO|nr:VOC family protein [Paucilactobacillus suebicus]KRM12807.1 glyoxalase bleomycin resistance protein dioxygenase [Paucilactobacillus suebicus DSM 5007 = KCTC 3549]
MDIKRIAHASFKVSDMRKSVEYYCDGLGMKQKFELKDENGDPWINYLEIKPGQFLELFYDFDNLPYATHGYDFRGFLHISLEVEDLEATKAELESKGLAIDSEIKFGPDKSYQLWSHDPDGNQIEFMQYTKDSFQLRQ